MLLTGGALLSIESPALYLPPRGHGALLFLGIVCAELALIAALSPEVGDTLVRLGYTDPCELRQVPAERTLAALRRSRAWRRHASTITTEMPTDMWRELCWRYVVFPCRPDGGNAEVVFAVQLKRHRPLVLAAIAPLNAIVSLDAGGAPRLAGPRTHRAPCPRRTRGGTGLCSYLGTSNRQPRKLDIRPEGP